MPKFNFVPYKRTRKYYILYSPEEKIREASLYIVEAQSRNQALSKAYKAHNPLWDDKTDPIRNIIKDEFYCSAYFQKGEIVK